ncbi:hypothetical protein V1264_025107 [Littorina saxatilis]|uniref:DUF6729 domain-containing protein n=1 Tax=Littorina saxatilis TaxID=31220 RepID=A0AAN9FZN4_9CAEN
MCLISGGFPLSQAWWDSLPQVDHAWVSKAFFRWSSSNPDTPELDYSRIHKLWWYPAQPALIHNLCPGIDRYFGHRLFVWMPKRLWKYVLVCPHSHCTGVELSHAGSYPIVKKVLDIDGYYLMVTEYLKCPDCRRKVIPWSAAVLAQLDVGHRSEFPAIPTYKYFCNKRVARMLRLTLNG